MITWADMHSRPPWQDWRQQLSARPCRSDRHCPRHLDETWILRGYISDPGILTPRLAAIWQNWACPSSYHSSDKKVADPCMQPYRLGPS